MTKVFFPQIPSRLDKETKVWVPKMDVSDAGRFGEVETLLPAGTEFYAANDVTSIVKQRLYDLDYGQDDFVVAVGSPSIMAIVFAVAARRSNGVLNMLVWDRQTSRYMDYHLTGLQ
jgi:hypothetical protein